MRHRWTKASSQPWRPDLFLAFKESLSCLNGKAPRSVRIGDLLAKPSLVRLCKNRACTLSLEASPLDIVKVGEVVGAGSPALYVNMRLPPNASLLMICNFCAALLVCIATGFLLACFFDFLFPAGLGVPSHDLATRAPGLSRQRQTFFWARSPLRRSLVCRARLLVVCFFSSFAGVGRGEARSGTVAFFLLLLFFPSSLFPPFSSFIVLFFLRDELQS